MFRLAINSDINGGGSRYWRTITGDIVSARDFSNIFLGSVDRFGGGGFVFRRRQSLSKETKRGNDV